MKRLILYLSVTALILLAVMVIAYRYIANRDFFFQEIAQLVRAETGYTVSKPGPLQFSLLPRPTLTGFDLTIVNPSAQPNAALAKLGKLSFKLQWQSLFRGQTTLDVELDAADIDLQINAAGEANWMTAELQTSNGGPPFDLDRVDAEKTNFKYTNHQTDEILGLDLEHFDIDLGAGTSRARIDSAGRFGRSKFLAVGNVEYASDEQQLRLSLAVGAGEAEEVKVGDIEVPSVTAWIEQNAADFPLHGLIEGAVSIQDQVPYGKLQLKANLQTVAELAYMVEQLSYVREDIGPVAASGVMRLNGSDFDIEHLEAALHHDRLDLTVEGSIYNLLAETQFDLKTQMEAQSLKTVAVPGRAKGIAENLINRLGPVDVSASVKTEDQDILVTEIDLGLAHKSFTARFGGNLRVKEDDIVFNLDHHSDAVQAADLFTLFDLDYPGLSDLGPLNLNAQVSGQGGRYTLEHVAGNLQDKNVNTTVAGELSLVDKALSIDLDTTVDVENLSRLASVLPQGFEPYLQGLAGEAATQIKGSTDEFTLSNLKINLAGDDKEFALSGSLSDLPTNLKSQLDLRFLTNKSIALEQYFPKLVGLQLFGPLDLNATVRSAGNKIRIEHVQLQAARTQVLGGGLIDLSDDPPRIMMVMESPEFRTRLFVQDQRNTAAAESPADTAQPPAPVNIQPSGQELKDLYKAYTKAVTIHTDWVKDLNLYFSFHTGVAQLGAYTLDELYLTIDAREGVFTLAEYEVLLDGKPVSFQGQINTNFSPPTYDFAGKLQGDTLEALLNVEDNLFEGGELSGDFKLKSEGDDLGEVIQNLNGKALVTMGPLTIRSNALTVVSSDLLLSVLRGITRRPEDEPSSFYQCGVLGVEVESGVARVDKAFTMQAKGYNLAGDGRIDLNTGLVDFTVYPKARRGLGLSVSTLAGGFRVNGHLTAPNLGLGGGGLVTAMVTGYALTPTLAYASAANPVSATILFTGLFAQGLIDRLTASNFTCKNTLQRIERRRSLAYVPRNHHPGKMDLR